LKKNLQVPSKFHNFSTKIYQNIQFKHWKNAYIQLRSIKIAFFNVIWREWFWILPRLKLFQVGTWIQKMYVGILNFYFQCPTLFVNNRFIIWLIFKNVKCFLMIYLQTCLRLQFDWKRNFLCIDALKLKAVTSNLIL